MIKCWLCDKETNIKEDAYGDHWCPHCSILISVLNPAAPDWLGKEKISTSGEEWLNEEEGKMPNVNDLKEFLCATDVSDGDEIKFLDAGEFVDKDFSPEKDGSDIRTVLEINVELPGGKKKKYSPNGKSRDAMAEVFGPNSEDWVGKRASIQLVKQSVYGNIKNVIYLEPVKG